MEQQKGGFVDGRGQAAHLIVRFVSDAESDHLLAPHSSELQSRLCARILREFFNMNLRVCSGDWAGGNICTDTYLATLGQPRIRGGSRDPQSHPNTVAYPLPKTVRSPGGRPHPIQISGCHI